LAGTPTSQDDGEYALAEAAVNRHVVTVQDTRVLAPFEAIESVKEEAGAIIDYAKTPSPTASIKASTRR
jgi:hypothetical protein